MKRMLTGIARKYIPAMMMLFTAMGVYAQDITGAWYGVLEVQDVRLRLVFHIIKSGNGYSGTMDSPDQGAKGLEVSSVSFTDNNLTVDMIKYGIHYTGRLGDSGIIAGTFKQGGASFPMNLSREEIKEPEVPKIVRPQDPSKPYPYYTEDVTFSNKSAGIKLAGTLTMPAKEGSYPAVILITGSGPQNRDAEIFNHRPFLVLSDYLTRQGFAVLRYDDRGVAASGGVFGEATSADFAADVNAALEYLQSRKEIKEKEIGLIGHSEGGGIAQMVAAGNKNVAFVVMLAGPGLPGDEILLRQKALIEKADGVPDELTKKGLETNKALFDAVKTIDDDAALKAKLTEILAKAVSETDVPGGLDVDKTAIVKSEVESLVAPWMRAFIRYDPAPNLRKISCPVLALNGDKDMQVPAKDDLEAIRKYITGNGNRNVTVKEMKGMNHLFQECSTGSPSEYGYIEQTFSPVALKEISGWLQRQVK